MGFDAYVFTGLWTNWSKGRILGTTITLSATDSQVLSTFLATFVGLVATQLWKILSFVAHQIRTSKEDEDGINQQRQVILRNSTEPTGAAWSFTQQAFYWRKSARKPFLRSLPWIVLSILYPLGFAAIAIFGPLAITASMGSDRLIVSSRCGLFYPLKDALGAVALQQKDVNDSYAALSYSKSCYSGSPQTVDQCDIYEQPFLGWTINVKAACPFHHDICKPDNKTAFQIDTGLLNSDIDLGMNAPSNQRIQYRRVATCSPLWEHGRSRNVSGAQVGLGYPNDNIWLYFYGNRYGSRLYNATFFYNTEAATSNFGYAISSLSAYGNGSEGTSNFQPIPALYRPDGDLTLFFIEFNSIAFEHQNNDPVFAAHLPVPYSHKLNKTLYTSDDYVGTIGCLVQHQFCNPSNSKCTPLLGIDALDDGAGSITQIGFSAEQLTGPILRILNDPQSLDIGFSVANLGTAALVAQTTVEGQGLLQLGTLPNNQWQIEVTNWFTASLALLQSRLYEFAAGQISSPPGTKLLYFNTDVFRNMCKNQKTRKIQGTVSFSALGIAILLTFGTVIIVVSFFLEAVVLILRKLFVKGKIWKSLRWNLDDQFQLHRRVYEDAATWQKDTSGFPVTQKGDKFGRWDNERETRALGLDRTSTFNIIYLFKRQSDKGEST